MKTLFLCVKERDREKGGERLPLKKTIRDYDGGGEMKLLY
jgi:hypothetical protein